MTEIRMIEKGDLEALRSVLNSIELFPAEMLDDMIHDYFNLLESKDLWFTCTQDGTPVSIAYCAPEKLTNGTYNLYALGIKGDYHGQGIGKQMIQYIEEKLISEGQRIIIVETSSTPDYQTSRQFYENLNYTKEATIRDFWADGDDKIVYWKKIG